MGKHIKHDMSRSLEPTFPGHFPRPNIPPEGFQSLRMGAKHREWIERQALEVFTAMANKRRPFADCLASVLLTGMSYGAGAPAAILERGRLNTVEGEG